MSIHIKNISKSYRDKKALQNCSLTLTLGYMPYWVPTEPENPP